MDLLIYLQWMMKHLETRNKLVGRKISTNLLVPYQELPVTRFGRSMPPH